MVCGSHEISSVFFIFQYFTSSVLINLFGYLCPTSFCKKYDHFSFLCKQMDIFLGKLYIVRRVTSVPTFLA